MCHFAASSQMSPWTTWLLEVWRQATSASKGWSQTVCMILYYTNQGIILENWKPILSVKGLESFDIFSLVVAYVFHMVYFFFLKKSESYSVLSFSSFLENNFFLILNKRIHHCSSSSTPGNGPLSVGVGGLQKQRKHQEKPKGGFTTRVSILFPLTKTSKPVNLFYC